MTKYSNTAKIIASFVKGFPAGDTYEVWHLAERKSWDGARDAFLTHTNILIAIPLFVEGLPSHLLEFLETLPKKGGDTVISFILQSGFQEGFQLRGGEHFLEKLPKYLGCIYGGTLCRGGNFEIRTLQGKKLAGLLIHYERMGKLYAGQHNFHFEAAKKFAGPEKFPTWIRYFVGGIFKVFGRKKYRELAMAFDFDGDIMERPYPARKK